MRAYDFAKLTLSSITQLKTRSLLTTLGIAVGIAAVIILTAIGEGMQRFVLSEFTQFGTHLIGISPGKSTTTGMSGAVVGNIRPLTLDDAKSLRAIPQVLKVVPVIQGNATAEANSRSRRTTIYGVGHEAPDAWQFKAALGQFLPDDNGSNSRALAVLGAKVRHELFKSDNPLGRYIRVGGERYRVIGVMETKGQILGFDLDDSVYIPTQRAMDMFSRESLMEVDVLYSASSSAESVAKKIKQLLISRHGKEDFTIVTQEQMLETLGSILNVLTLAISAIGAISLLVGGIGILTIMTIAVSERINEIGLLCAVGAQRKQILIIFLGEAVLLAAIGGIAGLVLGIMIVQILHWAIPDLPVHISLFYILLAEVIAILIGLIAGIYPARQAIKLDPITALRTE